MSNYQARKNLIFFWIQHNPKFYIPKGYHVHHILPRSCGGGDDAKNLIALHPDDHISIHKHRGDYGFSSSNNPSQSYPWIYINNSHITKKHNKLLPIPQGWSRGRTWVSNRPSSEFVKSIAQLGGKITGNMKIKCPHCNKVNNPGNHKRWHGDNCKMADPPGVEPGNS